MKKDKKDEKKSPGKKNEEKEAEGARSVEASKRTQVNCTSIASYGCSKTATV